MLAGGKARTLRRPLVQHRYRAKFEDCYGAEPSRKEFLRWISSHALIDRQAISKGQLGINSAEPRGLSADGNRLRSDWVLNRSSQGD